jgi:hypothetical protein
MPYGTPDEELRIAFALGFLAGLLSALVIGGVFYVVGGYDFRGGK